MARGVYHYVKRYKNYQVIFDPWNSFTKNSHFTESEINDMLALGYLAVGTKFRTKSGRLLEVTENNTLRRLT